MWEVLIMDNKKSKYITYLITVIIEIAVTLLAVSLFSIVMNSVDIDYKYSPVFGSVSVALGCLIASYFLSNKKKNKGYLIGATIGVITFIVITLIGLIINQGGIGINTLFHLVIIMLSSIIGGILGVNKKGKKYI